MIAETRAYPLVGGTALGCAVGHRHRHRHRHRTA